jgi:uncharacterized membrane-anchored protein
MSEERLAGALRAAIEEGLLPPEAERSEVEPGRPWPVVLLTALGAWLAAIPLIAVVGILLGDLVTRGVGPYLVGALLLAGSLVVLRSRGVALFVEQLAVPVLLVGGGALAFGLFRDLKLDGGAAVLAAVVLAVGVAVRAAWLRVLLGAAAAGLLAVALVPERLFRADGSPLARWWWAWHGALAAWLLATLWLRRAASAAAAQAAQPIAAGWLLATLAGLAGWSGMTFMVGGSAGSGLGGEIARELGRRGPWAQGFHLQQAASALLALAGAAWAASRWPGLRRTWATGVGAVLVALAWFMPALGAAWLVLALCATAHRWRLATCAAFVAAWIIGAFYYQLDWPLGTKAMVLMAAGAILGVLAAWGLALQRVADAAAGEAALPHAGATAAAQGAGRGWLVAGVVLVLAVANGAIWQKESLIRSGSPVFVELAPVDPRSLMQGDFMRLAFRLPDVARDAESLLWGRRVHAIMRIDERGVATPVRAEAGTAAPPAAGELRIELTPKEGRWILVTDAWFFQEGQAQRYERARYGEFRVEPGGGALLVGLRGAKLEPL